MCPSSLTLPSSRRRPRSLTSLTLSDDQRQYDQEIGGSSMTIRVGIGVGRWPLLADLCRRHCSRNRWVSRVSVDRIVHG